MNRLKPRSTVEVGRRPKNTAEGLLHDKITANGLVPTKRGAPDFFVYDEDGRLLAVVEAKKNDSHGVKRAQSAALIGLALYGVPAYTWNPETGFDPVCQTRPWDDVVGPSADKGEYKGDVCSEGGGE